MPAHASAAGARSAAGGGAAGGGSCRQPTASNPIKITMRTALLCRQRG
jgi:hypothetical protein